MRFPSVAHLAYALEPYATRRGRVSIEQILATLNVTIADDGLNATMRADVAPRATPRRPALPLTAQQTAPLPSAPPPAPSTPRGLRDARQTGPHFTVSAPAAAPPSFVRAPTPAARSMSSHLPFAAIVLLLLGTAGVAWRALRAPTEAVVTDRRGAASPVPVAVPSTAGSAPPAPTGDVAPAPTATPTATASPTATDVPPTAPSDSAARPKLPPSFRPRPHVTPPRVATTPTTTNASAPPNPADVPGGRH
jgi:hypothetical protein